MTLEDLIRLISEWIAQEKTGSIQVNFFKGSIPNINLNQCIKTEKKGECK